MLRRAVRAGVPSAAALLVLATSASAGDPIPTPIGVGPGFHPGPTSSAVAAARPAGRHVCGAAVRQRVRAHVELFAQRRVVIVPAGIGVAPPLRIRDGFVVHGRCSYPIRTVEPTGVIEVDAAVRPKLGDLFAVWGRRLAPNRLLSFSGRVQAFVAGKRWRGDPRRIPLRRHAQIVLEVGGYIPPHRSYLFGEGR
jgi:hypothetical protein